MANCCSRQGYDEVFTDRLASRDAKRYRRRGLDSTARRLVGFLARRRIDGGTVLDVGGGVGAIGLELLKAGADRAVTIELSHGYDEDAASLAREVGVEDRVERRALDFAEPTADLPPAEVVVMHRVVCCYPDYEALLGAASTRAGRLLAFSFPRSTWWTRAANRLANLLVRFRSSAFKSYVHPPAALISTVERHGFRLTAEHEGLVWWVAGFERAT
jgi:cyclopropane fatty-acyl-phospholipid synthase-like methyltransferase